MDDRHVMRLIKAAEAIAASLAKIAESLGKQVQLDADTRHMMDVVMRADAEQAPQSDPHYVKPPEWMTRG